MPLQKKKKYVKMLLLFLLLSELSIWALDAATALVVFVRFIIYIFQNTDVIVFYCSNITIIYEIFCTFSVKIYNIQKTNMKNETKSSEGKMKIEFACIHE